MDIARRMDRSEGKIMQGFLTGTHSREADGPLTLGS